MRKQKKKNKQQSNKNMMKTSKQHWAGKCLVLFHRIGCQHR
jgi:hypothetical protein